MAFVGSFLCTVFKKHILEGIHDFRTDGSGTFKMALYTNDANLDDTTEAYTPVGEITGTGYTAGGIVIPKLGTFNQGTAGFATFNTASWPGASFTARGALIYNSTPSSTYQNPAVMVLDFGYDRTATNQPFSVLFPSADLNNAIIRFL